MKSRGRIALLLCLGLLSGLAAGCEERDVKAAISKLARAASAELIGDLEEARIALREREWDRAARYLERFLRTGMDSRERWEAWNSLIDATERAGQDRRWINAHLEAMLVEFENDPDRMRTVLRRMGENQEMSRQYERAVQTWAQFAALPTSPAALWPILQADSKVGVASQKGIPEEDWLYDSIMETLKSNPVAPAMRMALLADAEKIPGVIPVGTYTDSAGRTGIALRVTWNEGPGSTDTTVVDTSNGQILAEIQTEPGQQGCTTTKPKGGGTETSCIVSNSGTLFLSAAAVNSAPSEAFEPPAVIHQGTCSQSKKLKWKGSHCGI
jgi:uncharacterized protein with PIN domain